VFCAFFSPASQSLELPDDNLDSSNGCVKAFCISATGSWFVAVTVKVLYEYVAERDDELTLHEGGALFCLCVCGPDAPWGQLSYPACIVSAHSTLRVAPALALHDSTAFGVLSVRT
jgi:hypothetical protein